MLTPQEFAEDLGVFGVWTFLEQVVGVGEGTPVPVLDLSAEPTAPRFYRLILR